jgi:hypothetical protein
MRIFKAKHRFNWKYILGEILLIFLSINLAIWFNNWNISRINNKAKMTATAQIKGELTNNLIDLELSNRNARSVGAALRTILPLFRQNKSKIETTPEKMNDIQTRYPGVFRIADSTQLDSLRYAYHGSVVVELELVELSDIAWETTKSLDILNEFGYECLYELESMYSLQSRVQKEIDKSSDALQNNDLDALLIILSFIDQLEIQLEKKYKKTLSLIDNC